MSNIETVYFAPLKRNARSEKDRAVEEVCIANISPRERRLRLNFAIQQFVITLVSLAGMIALQMDPRWRLVLFFLFSASTTSFFQSLDKT